MSDTIAQTKTKVIGYFNPHPWSVFIEISECNFKVTLPTNIYVRDSRGRFYNDPILEDYVSPQGLSKSEGEADLPIYFLPRVVVSARAPSSVSTARSFASTPDGQTVPVYDRASDPALLASVTIPENRNPIRGMSIEEARQKGLIGKPRLVPEEYGADEAPGAGASGERIPSIKYAIESNPRVRTAAPLPVQLQEVDESVPPQEVAQRVQIQQKVVRSAAMAAPDQVEDQLLAAGVKPRPAPPSPLPAPKAPAPAPKPVARNAAKPVPVSAAAAPVEAEPMAGVPVPMDEGTPEEEMPEPDLEAQPPVLAEGKRFICLSDGRSFNYRSELERHIKRKYPTRLEELMKPYPGE